jgi:hypothetical protein
MKKDPTITALFVFAGAVLILAGALAPSEWLLFFGGGIVVGALAGPAIDWLVEVTR